MAHQQEANHPDPWVFRPDRFLDGTPPVIPTAADPVLPADAPIDALAVALEGRLALESAPEDVRVVAAASDFPGPVAASAPRITRAVFRSIFDPLMDLIGRLGWGALLVLLLALTYRFTDSVWGSFAFPFYLDDRFGALHHTMADVAVASKFFGADAGHWEEPPGAAAPCRSR